MSAFIVGDTHIDALLTFAQSAGRYGASWYYWNGERIFFGGNETRIGQKLLDENVRSYNYRYEKCERPDQYAFSPYLGDLTPARVIGACDCLIYQSCETPDYRETEAFSIIDAIRELAIDLVPGKDGSWEITE